MNDIFDSINKWSQMLTFPTMLLTSVLWPKIVKAHTRFVVAIVRAELEKYLTERESLHVQ